METLFYDNSLTTSSSNNLLAPPKIILNKALAYPLPDGEEEALSLRRLLFLGYHLLLGLFPKT